MAQLFVSSFLVSALLIAVQELAMLPWLLALGTRTRQRLGTVGLWLQGTAIAVIGGAVAAAYMVSDPNNADTMRYWGRFYLSILHAQLSVDFFIAVLAVLLGVWPKGAAVALAAFREGLRQPMFWLLTGAAVFMMAISPFIPYFTFGEDFKMVKELCYAFTMLFPALFGIVVASMSVHDEIEGRTAVTVMSKPISRRQFLLGKFVGVTLAALAMTVLLGWVLVWIVLFKQTWDPSMYGDPIPEPEWVGLAANATFSQVNLNGLAQGIYFWINDAGEALPGLAIGFCQVMVLVAAAVAMATRVPMVVNVVGCLAIYLLGHLTGIMTESGSGGQGLIDRTIQFVAQLLDTIFPGLDLFDVGNAIVRDVPLPYHQFAAYALNVSLYGITYTAIALLVGLILFEDRDLA
ncbi:MAG: ABC transporter permease [Gemmataceae bacterium]|nr:ABC transporter permease [Gemmataceae bacterium]